MLETQVLLQDVVMDGGRRRALGQSEVGGHDRWTSLPFLPSPGEPWPSLSQGQVCWLGNWAAASLRQRSRGGSNINFKSARA